MSLFGLISLLVVLLLLSAFFAGSETALMSLNRYHLRHKSRKGNRGAKLAEQLLKRPDRLIGLILLGNNLVNFSASALVTLIAFDLGGEPAVAIGTGILTLTVIIFADIAPKTVAALNPERFAFPAAMIYYPLLKITYPIVWLTNMASNGFLFLLGIRDKGNNLQTLTREELRTVVRETSTRIPTRYREMLLSILDLEKVTVADVMVPHKEIIGIDINDNNVEIEKAISDSHHTRLPVYQGNLDKIVGILHLRNFANTSNKSFSKKSLHNLLNAPYFVPEGTSLSTQLIHFQRQNERIALVVDEYGDIQGIITLEDILEEIVGEFTDPLNEENDVIQNSPNSFIVDAMANIRELNRSQNWELPSNGPKTLNGLIIEMLETIPEPSTCLKINGYPIEIIESNDNCIESVQIGTRIYEREINE
tara:strand:+ start:7472 stop:8734 length:1263 start_codon:yes stop_codon:yes gene_type:complete